MTAPPAAGPELPSGGPTFRQQAAFGLLLAVVAGALAVFSAFPWTASDPGAARLRLAVKHVAARQAAARRLSAEELERLPRHMRPLEGVQPAVGRRLPSTLEVCLDGGVLLRRVYQPGGLRHDGPTFVDEELAVPTGRHRLEIRLVDGEPGLDGPAGRASEDRAEFATCPGPGDGRDAAPGERASPGASDPPTRWHLARDVDIQPRQVLLVEFLDETGLTVR